jgi:recombination protein RecA
MTRSAAMTATLATLQARWGSAAPVRGALALAPAPVEDERPGPLPDAGGVVSTGFPALDAILGPGGVPRTASVALRGTGWSGKTTLAFRLVAEAQAAGAIVAWLDVGRSLDPIEAVARGVRLEWLVVIDPLDLDEGLAIGGSLLAGRTVDLLVLDLPTRRTGRASHLADRLGRLAALARRADTGLLVLEPPGLGPALAGAVAESTALRLELSRRDWIQLGRDVVGQRTDVVVARNRYGPPDRRAELRILYADGGERDACLRRTGLLHDPPEPVIQISPHQPPAPGTADATPSSLLAAPAARSRPPATLRLVPERSGHPRRAAMDRRDRAGRRPAGSGARRPAGDAPRQRPSARAGGDVPRS